MTADGKGEGNAEGSVEEEPVTQVPVTEEPVAWEWAALLGRHGADREALALGRTSLDYAGLGAAVRAAGESLRAAGIEAGDRVAVLAPASIEGVVLIHALLSQRTVLLPLSPRLSPVEQDFVLASSGARWLAVSEIDEAIRGLTERADCGLLRFSGSWRRAPDPGAWSPARSGPAPIDGLELELAIERRPPELAPAALEARRAALRDRGAALVLYTSGTSGRPKGAILSFANLIASARAQARLLGSSGSSDRWLLCMPLFHVGGLSILIRSALAGSAVVLHERFEVGRVSEALEREGITQVSFVTTMLSRLLEHRGARRAPESLRCVLLGGGPAPSALVERAIGLGYPIAPTYGLTEAASQVATRPPQGPVGPGEDPAAGLRPLPGVELRIVDEARRVLGPGAVGEIEVRGPIVMAGYLDDPAATARTLRAGGWLATGDLGALDSAGGLRVLDRRGDLIISGGENVYPAEVEAVLAAHPQVAEAGVVGLHDPVFGQRPYAFVVWRGEAGLEAEVLLHWCRDRLAAFKRPIGIRAVESLPRTASGKLIRRSLAAVAAERDG